MLTDTILLQSVLEHITSRLESIIALFKPEEQATVQSNIRREAQSTEQNGVLVATEQQRDKEEAPKQVEQKPGFFNQSKPLFNEVDAWLDGLIAVVGANNESTTIDPSMVAAT